ncbi:major facilitator superfamily domain-containing protein [Leucosporidium creatinivorum]|uniref:Major facilitator superfamily domain-containing protein n=1 Tax=Leucosporidium creatinivorum TaxID=106004 RepID=A0A1Y2DB00_9BASI|nr:major facilitator superfamily domain-containing protein [Leucosporidium creatinivorum]
MANDTRCTPPRFDVSGSTAPSLAATDTTLCGDSISPASPARLQGGSELAKICSSRLGTAEAMLAGSGRDELERCSADRVEEEKEGTKEERSIGAGPALAWEYPEGGRGWWVVLGCFIFACSQMGYGLTWGVLVQDLVKQHPNQPIANLNLCVGATNFCMNASSFIGGRLGDRFGYKRMIAIGSACTFIILIISAFASHSLPALFIFQGALLGLSQGCSMPLILSFPAQWFSKKRGMATGLAASGSGIGGGIASLIMRALLPKIGYRNTMLVYAGLNGVSWSIAWFLLKVRLPPLAAGERRVPKNWLPRGIWGSSTWWSWILTVTVGIFGYLTPYYFLTAYTTFKCPQLDPTSITPAVPLIISNFTSGMGRILAGFLADRLGPINTLFLSFFLGGLLQLVFWPYATTFGSIAAFGALEGLTGSWFMSLIPVAAAQLFGLEGLATIVGFTVLANSPGQMLGATISGLVLETGGGSNYAGVAYYAGSAMCAGAAILLWARFKNEKRIFARV